MKRIFLTLWLALVAPLAFAIPTAPSVTFGITPDPNTLTSTQFNKYDGSVFVKTSDGTANGTVDSVWHYSVKNNKWVKVPVEWGKISGTLSNQSDLQNALDSKQSNLSLTTLGSGAASLTSSVLNIPTPTLSSIGAESAIVAGTNLQFWRGDKTWQTLNTLAVAESINLYFTDARARASISAGTGIAYSNSTGVISSTVPSMQRFVLSNAFSSTSVTQAAITGWSFPVTAGKSYRIEIVGTYQTAAVSTGGTLGVVLTGGGVGTIAGELKGKIASLDKSTPLVQSIFAINATVGTAGSTLTTSGVGAINQPHYIGGVLVFNCTTSGKFQLNYATEVAASASQLNAGSTLYVTEF